MATPDEIRKWRSEFTALLTDQNVLNGPSHQSLLAMLKEGKSFGFVDDAFINKYQTFRQRRLEWARQQPLYNSTTGQPLMKTNARNQQVPRTGADLFVGNEFRPEIGAMGVEQERAKRFGEFKTAAEADIARLGQVREALAPSSVLGNIGMTAQALSETARSIPTTGRLALSGLTGGLVAPPSAQQIRDVMVQRPIEDVMAMTPEQARLEAMKPARAGGFAFGEGLAPTVGGVVGGQAAGAALAMSGLAAGPLAPVAMPVGYFLGSLGGAALAGKAQEWLLKNAYGDKVYEEQIAPLFGQALQESGSAGFAGQMGNVLLQGSPVLSSGIGARRTLGLVRSAWSGRPVTLQGTAEELGTTGTFSRLAQTVDGAAMPNMVSRAGDSKYQTVVSNLLDRVRGASDIVANRYKTFTPTPGASFMQRQGELGKFVQSTPGAADFVGDLIGEQFANLGQSTYDYMQAVERSKKTGEPVNTAEMLANLAFGSIFIGNNRFTDSLGAKAGAFGGAVLEGAKRIPGAAKPIESIQDRYRAQNLAIQNNILGSAIRGQINSDTATEYESIVKPRKRINVDIGGNIYIHPDERAVPIGNGAAVVFNPQTGESVTKPYSEIFGTIDDSATVEQGKLIGTALNNLPTERSGRGLDKLAAFGGRDIVPQVGTRQQQIVGISKTDQSDEAHVYVREIVPIKDEETGVTRTTPEYHVLRVQDLEQANQQLAEKMLSEAGLVPSQTKYSSPFNRPELADVDLIAPMSVTQAWQEQQRQTMPAEILKEFPTIVQFDEGIQLQTRVVGTTTNGDVLVQVFSPTMDIVRVNPTNIQSTGRGNMSTATRPQDPVQLSELINDQEISDAAVPKQDKVYDIFANPETGLHTVDIGSGYRIPIMFTSDQLNELPSLIDEVEQATNVARRQFADRRKIEKARSSAISSAMTQLFDDGQLPSAEFDWEIGSTIKVATPNGEEWGVVLDTTDAGPIVMLPSQDFKPVLVQESAVIDGKKYIRQDISDIDEADLVDQEEAPAEGEVQRKARRKPYRAVQRRKKPAKTPSGESIDTENLDGINRDQAKQLASREEAKAERRVTERQARAIRGDDLYLYTEEGKKLPIVEVRTLADGRKKYVNLAQNIIRKIYEQDQPSLTQRETALFEALKFPNPNEEANDIWYRNAYQGVSFLNSGLVQTALAKIGTAVSNDVISITGSEPIALESLSFLNPKEQKALVDSGFVTPDGMLDKSGIKVYSASERGLFFGTVLQQYDTLYDSDYDPADVVMALAGPETLENAPKFGVLRSTDKATFTKHLTTAFKKTAAANNKTDAQIKKDIDAVTTLFDTIIHGVVSRKVEMVIDGIVAGAFSSRATGQERIPTTRQSQQVQGHQIAPLMDELRPLFLRLRNSLNLSPQTDMAKWIQTGANQPAFNLAVAKLVDEEVSLFYAERIPDIADFKSFPAVNKSLGQYMEIYDPEQQTTTKIIMAFKAADVSTFVHEIAHAVFAGMPYAQKKEISGALGHGLRVPTITHTSVLTFEAQEKFAYGLEVSLANIGLLKDKNVWAGTNLGENEERGASKTLFDVLLAAGNVVDTAYHSLVKQRAVNETKEGYERVWRVQYSKQGRPVGTVWMYKGAPIILKSGEYAICNETIGTSRRADRELEVIIDGQVQKIKAGEIEAIGGPLQGLSKTVMQTLSLWIAERRKDLKTGLIESTPAVRRKQLKRNQQGEVVRLLREYSNQKPRDITNNDIDGLIRSLGMTPRSDQRRDIFYSAIGLKTLSAMKASKNKTARAFAKGRRKEGQTNGLIHAFTLATIESQLAGRLNRVLTDKKASLSDKKTAQSILDVINGKSNNADAVRRYEYAFKQIFNSIHANRFIVDKYSSALKQINGDVPQERWQIQTDSTGSYRISPNGTVVIVNTRNIGNQFGKKQVVVTYTVNVRTGTIVSDNEAEGIDGGDIEEGQEDDTGKPELQIAGGDYSAIQLPDNPFFNRVKNVVKTVKDKVGLSQAQENLKSALRGIGLSETSFRIVEPEVLIAAALVQQAQRKNKLKANVANFNLGNFAYANEDVTTTAQELLISPEDMAALAPLDTQFDAEESTPLTREKKMTLLISAYADRRLPGFASIYQYALHNFKAGNVDQFNRQMQMIADAAEHEMQSAFSGMDADWDISYLPSIIGNDPVPAVAGSISVTEDEVVKVLGRAASIGKKLAQANVFVTEPAGREEVGYSSNGWFVVPSLTFNLNRDIDLVELRLISDLAPDLLNGAVIDRQSDGSIKLHAFMVPSSDFGRSEAMDWANKTKDFFNTLTTNEGLRDAGNPIEAVIESEGKLRLWNIGSAENGGKGSFREYQEVLDLLRSVAPNDALPSTTIQTPHDDQIVSLQNQRIAKELEQTIQLIIGKSFKLPEAIRVNPFAVDNSHRVRVLAKEAEAMPEDAYTSDMYVPFAYLMLKKELAKQFVSLNIRFDFMPLKDTANPELISTSGTDWNILNPYGDDFNSDEFLRGRPSTIQMYRTKAAEDIANNRHLYIFKSPNAAAYQANAVMDERNPMDMISPFKTQSGDTMLWSDVLHAVQSTLQHGLFNTSYRNQDALRLNAYGMQAMMTQQPLAILALANETIIRNAAIEFNGPSTINATQPLPCPVMRPEYFMGHTHKVGVPSFNLAFSGINQVDDRLRLFQVLRQQQIDPIDGLVKNQPIYLGSRSAQIARDTKIKLGGYVPLYGPRQRSEFEIKNLIGEEVNDASWAKEEPFLRKYSSNTTYWHENHKTLVKWAITAIKVNFTNQMHRAIYELQNGRTINLSDQDRLELNQPIMVAASSSAFAPSSKLEIAPVKKSTRDLEFELKGLNAVTADLKDAIGRKSGEYTPSPERFMAAAAALLYELQTNSEVPSDTNGKPSPIYRAAGSWSPEDAIGIAEFSTEYSVAQDTGMSYVPDELKEWARLISIAPSKTNPVKGLNTNKYSARFPTEWGWIIPTWEYQIKQDSHTVEPYNNPSSYIGQISELFKNHLNNLVNSLNSGKIDVTDSEVHSIIEAGIRDGSFTGNRHSTIDVVRYLVSRKSDTLVPLLYSDPNATTEDPMRRIDGLIDGLSAATRRSIPIEDVILVHNPKRPKTSRGLDINLSTQTITGNFSEAEMNAYVEYQKSIGSMPMILPGSDDAKEVLSSFFGNADVANATGLFQTADTNEEAEGTVPKQPNLLIRTVFMMNQLLRTGATGDASPILMQNFIQANLLENPAMMLRQIKLIGQVLTNPNLEIELPLSDGRKIMPGALRGRKLFDELLDAEVRSRKNYDDAEKAGLSLAAINRKKALDELRETNPDATYNDIDELGYNTDVASDLAFLKHLPGQGTSERFFALSKDIVKMNTWDSMVQTLVELGYNPTKWEYNEDGSVKHTTWTRALTDLAHLLNITAGDIKFVDADDADERIARIGKLMFFAPRWLTSRLLLNSWGRGMLEFAGARFGKDGENWAQKILAVNGMSRRQLGARDSAVAAMHGRLMYKAYLQWLALILGIYAAGATNPHTMKVSVEGSMTKFEIGDYSFRAPGAIMAHIELTAAVLEGMNAFNAQKPGPEAKGKLEMVWNSVSRVLMSRASPIVSLGGEVLTGRDIFGEPAFIPDEAVDRFYQEAIKPSLETAGITSPSDVKVDKAISRRMMWWWLHDMMEAYDQERKVGFSQANAMLKATALGAYSGLGGRVSFQSERLKWKREAAKRIEAVPSFTEIFSGAEAVPIEPEIYDADKRGDASSPVPSPLIGDLGSDPSEPIPGYE